MKMKKVFAGLVLFGASLALVACGSSNTTTESSSSTSTASSSATEKTVDVSTLQDGTYKGESDYDERGWKVVDSITIKDGKITESNFGYEDKDGNKKADDAEYNKSMEAKSGISSKDATAKLNAELVEKQDISAVEVVSGATTSSNNFVVATEALLAAAEKGDTSTVKIQLSE